MLNSSSFYAIGIDGLILNVVFLIIILILIYKILIII